MKANKISIKPVRIGKSSRIVAMLTLTMLGFAQLAQAQKELAMNALTKYGLDKDLINKDYFKQPDNYAYDLEQTTTAANKTTVLLAKYDPQAASPWTVLSVDGKAPKKADISAFEKAQAEENERSKPQDASYRVDEETADKLVISYKLDPATLSKELAFMKDCRIYIHISLQSKRLLQSELVNEKPVKIKILTAEKFISTVQYQWDTTAHRYFTLQNEVDMQGKFMGQKVDVHTQAKYSNFKKADTE
ncbi:hypothetical protein [Sphingobacterium bambusae]|uniref:DUF1571 domain-containing protein n=1 Tax=Sphingobacterium bambusae TaxID=662858 RepID=A0ABW6BAA1_9SPHI|nr:hypothetical protein [Sphingobacterium bambusae]WPL48593.1 hypothetical protein SCB77_21835 [Sphingobacterium bambusae]